MLLHFLPFIYLRLDKFSYTIDEATTFNVTSNVAVLPYQTEGFTFQDSNNQEITDFPHIFYQGSTFIVTPTPEKAGTNLTITANYLFEDCPTVEYVLNGFLMTNETAGYYSDRICYLFFPREDSLLKLNMNVSSVGSNTVRYYYYRSGTSSTLYQSTQIPEYPTALVIIESDRTNEVVRLMILDQNMYDFGDNRKTIRDVAYIPVPPSSVFIAKNTEGFTFESDIAQIGEGIFFNNLTNFNVKVTGPGPADLYYSIVFVNPYMNYTDLNVEIFGKSTHVLFSTSDYDFDVRRPTVYCHILTSPNIIRYKFCHSSAYAENFVIHYPNNVFYSNLECYYGFPYIGQTVVLYASAAAISGDVFGLQTSDLLVETNPKLTFRNESFHIIGDNLKNENPANDHYDIKSTTANINFANGFYQIYIPAEGRTLDFQVKTLVVFHNGKSFSGTISSDRILESTGNYVINFTTKCDTMEIKPLDNKPLIANISVLNYYYRSFDSTTLDVIVSPNKPQYFKVLQSIYQQININKVISIFSHQVH